MPLRRGLLESPIDGERPDPAMVEHKWGMFLELMRWAEGGSCRHDAILRYFGDEAEVLSGCGICDVCQRLADGVEEQDPEEVTLIVRKALSAVARIHGRLGLTAAIKLLKGAKDERLVRYGLDQTRTAGALSEHPEEWIGRLLRRCVTAGWVGFTVSDRPVALLTADGEAVMRAERPARLLLPEQAERRPRRSRASGSGGAAGIGVDDLDAAGQAVFEALRAHRLDRARELNVPPYVVASDRTLREIAMLRPRDVEQLLMCHGIGPAKAEKYGSGLLEVVQDTVERHAAGT
jgi:ATP-dependent DNA helicase RecQ